MGISRSQEHVGPPVIAYCYGLFARDDRLVELPKQEKRVALIVAEIRVPGRPRFE